MPFRRKGGRLPFRERPPLPEHRFFGKFPDADRPLFFLPGDEGLQLPDMLLHDLVVVEIKPFPVFLQCLAILLPVLELPCLLPDASSALAFALGINSSSLATWTLTVVSGDNSSPLR